MAIATPPGKGGVGIVRFSFPDRSHFQEFLKSFAGRLIPPREVNLLRLRDDQAYLIDEGVGLRFDAPASFTGEFVFEFQGHGGQAVLQAVIERAFAVAQDIQVPLRHANPGEFTQRAFLNDKLDLAQAEAIADLIDAGSMRAARAAAASLNGEFSRLVNGLAEKIIHLRLLLEATLDFPEEEIDFLEKANAKGQLANILSIHEKIITSAKDGVRFRDGLRLVLAGKPNVGKSSLLNALCGEEVAIVTEIAGTTRDKIEQQLNIRGVPLVVIDTAGLRRTSDKVETIGIERTKQEILKADILVYLQSADELTVMEDFQTVGVDSVFKELEISIPDSIPVLSVINKVDLLSGDPPMVDDSLFVSAINGDGLEDLKDRLFKIIGLDSLSTHGFMARQRHVEALQRCGNHLLIASNYASQDDRILDLFAEELRLAHDCLGEITGGMLPDDLLGLIFSRFCIGK